MNDHNYECEMKMTWRVFVLEMKGNEWTFVPSNSLTLFSHSPNNNLRLLFPIGKRSVRHFFLIFTVPLEFLEKLPAAGNK
jgi:hypothetical protein